jgi:hypothetical protein
LTGHAQFRQKPSDASPADEFQHVFIWLADDGLRQRRGQRLPIG